MFDCLIALVLLGCGYWLGKRNRRAVSRLDSGGAEESCQLQEDRIAFSQLMGYNAQRAYGLQDVE